MLKKYGFTGKGFPTFAALVSPLTSMDMDSLMLSKSVFATEGFPTFIALVRPFSSVNSLVPYKYMFVTKRFPTFTAPIRPFSSVDISVLNKYIFTDEGFPTFSIFIRPLSSVDSLVLSKLGLLGGFPTFVAFTLPLSIMRKFQKLSVLLQFNLVLEIVRDTREILPSLTVHKSLPQCVDCASLHKGLTHVSSKEFISTVLLKFQTCSTQGLAGVYSHVLSYTRTTFYIQATHVPGRGWVERSIFEVFLCGTSTETFCSEVLCLIFIPCQQPETRDMRRNFT